MVSESVSTAGLARQIGSCRLMPGTPVLADTGAVGIDVLVERYVSTWGQGRAYGGDPASHACPGAGGPVKGRSKMDEKLLYRVTEVAASLSLSRSTVYELVRSGVLPSVRIGGSRRIRGEDVARYVDSLERVTAGVS